MEALSEILDGLVLMAVPKRRTTLRKSRLRMQNKVCVCVCLTIVSRLTRHAVDPPDHTHRIVPRVRLT